MREDGVDPKPEEKLSVVPPRKPPRTALGTAETPEPHELSPVPQPIVDFAAAGLVSPVQRVVSHWSAALMTYLGVASVAIFAAQQPIGILAFFMLVVAGFMPLLAVPCLLLVARARAVLRAGL